MRWRIRQPILRSLYGDIVSGCRWPFYPTGAVPLPISIRAILPLAVLMGMASPKDA